MRSPNLFWAMVLAPCAWGQVPPNAVAIYQPSPSLIFYAHDLAVNAAGEVWSYGVARDTSDRFIGTILKYVDAGTTQAWTHTFVQTESLSDIELDSEGNVYVGASQVDTVGDTRSNVLVRKIGPDGTLLWENIFTGQGPNSLDRFGGMCVEANGQVVVTGFSEQPNYQWAWLTLKYSAEGELLWSALYPGTGDQRAEAVDTDNEGNVYVTGKGPNAETGDLMVVKYDANGNELWVRHAEEGTSSMGQHLQVWQDRVYAAGWTTTDAQDHDLLVIAYDTSGTELWRTPFDAPPYFPGTPYNGREQMNEMAVDAQGNVYFTGTEFMGTGNSAYMLVKISPDGALLWNVHYNGQEGAHWDEAWGLTVAGTGGVYVTGFAQNVPEGVQVLYTLKYDADGALLWYAPYTPAPTDHCYSGHIGCDDAGNVYVNTATATDDGELVLLRYGVSTGVRPIGQDRLLHVLPDPQGAGFCVDLSTWNEDLQLTIMDASGRELGHERVRGGGVWRYDGGRLPPGQYVLCVNGKGMGQLCMDFVLDRTLIGVKAARARLHDANDPGSGR